MCAVRPWPIIRARVGRDDENKTRFPRTAAVENPGINVEKPITNDNGEFIGLTADTSHTTPVFYFRLNSGSPYVCMCVLGANASPRPLPVSISVRRKINHRHRRYESRATRLRPTARTRLGRHGGEDRAGELSRTTTVFSRRPSIGRQKRKKKISNTCTSL